ncbi:MAG TPA: ATP-binding protein [Mycobacteriales bacterium]|nr:ATP-binding protein [Mycobacteriales bacterium]
MPTTDTAIRQLVHDIRSPVAAIEASASALLLRPNMDPDTRGLLELVVQEARAVHDMASQALGDGARRGGNNTEAARRQSAKRTALLSDVLHLVARRCSAAWDRPVRVATKPAFGDCQLSMPAAELARALTNIVDNAFQHGHAASVTIEADRRNSQVLVRVRMRGIDLTHHTRRSSHGLGLTYVGRFAREHGVSVQVRGRGVDRVDELTFPDAG